MLINIVVIAICVCCGAYGQELFNIDKEMCCNANVFPKPMDQDQIFMPFCCGQGTIDIRKELCCQNKTVKLPAEAIINMTTLQSNFQQSSFMDPTIPHYACCGETYFNYDTDLCCDDTVIRKPTQDEAFSDLLMQPTFWTCCGGKLLNASAQDCCRGKVMDKSSQDESCCGDRLIDNSKEVCCFDNFPDDNEDPTVLPKQNMDDGCCGRNRIDYRKEICCINKVHEIPVLDEVTQQVFPMCCGENLWTPAGDEVCCNGQVIKQSGPIGCCEAGTFNYDTQICCAGTILPKGSNRTFCCGKTTYDEMKEETCCQSSGIVMPIVDSEKRFCCE